MPAAAAAASTSMPVAAASATSSSFDEAVSSIVLDTTSAGKSSEEDRIQDLLSENLDEVQVQIVLDNKQDPFSLNVFFKAVHDGDENHTQFTPVTLVGYEPLLKSREYKHTATSNALKRMRGEVVVQTKGPKVKLRPEERDPKTGFKSAKLCSVCDVKIGVKKGLCEACYRSEHGVAAYQRVVVDRTCKHARKSIELAIRVSAININPLHAEYWQRHLHIVVS